LSTLQCGGSRALSLDKAELLEDLRFARPTIMGATPAFWTMVHQLWSAKVAELSGERGAEAMAAAAVRSTLGGRLYLATSSGVIVEISGMMS
jgi:long-subunit acyl-CoA synthetase (AMP-forming)